MQELSAEEAVVASHAPPQMGILTMLAVREVDESAVSVDS